MRQLPAVSAAVLLHLLLAAPAQAARCEGLRDGIDAKLRAAGVNDHKLSIVDANAVVAGKVVGQCELGTKKIVLVRGSSVSTVAPPPPAAPAKTRPLPMLTECKDGSVPADGDCRRKAVR